MEMMPNKLVCFEASSHKPVGTHLSKTWANKGIQNTRDFKLPFNTVGLNKNYALLDVVGKSETTTGSKCDFFFMTYPDWSFYDLFSRSKNRDIYITMEFWSFVPTMICATPDCYKIQNDKLLKVPINFSEFIEVGSSKHLQSIKFKINSNSIKDVLCRGVYVNVGQSHGINMTIKAVCFDFVGKK